MWKGARGGGRGRTTTGDADADGCCKRRAVRGLWFVYNGKEREGIMSKIWTENGGLIVVQVRQPRRHHQRLDMVKWLILVVVIAGAGCAGCCVGGGGRVVLEDDLENCRVKFGER